MHIFVNDKVLTEDWKVGIVKFIGRVTGKDEYYYGLELIGELGKNNGTYKKIPYFIIKSNHTQKNGLFIKHDRIKEVKSRKKSFGCIINDKVYVKKIKTFGQIVYIGMPKNEKKWILGIELEKSNGTTNGKYKDNIQYFQTKRKTGRTGYYCTADNVKSDTFKTAKNIIKQRINHSEKSESDIKNDSVDESEQKQLNEIEIQSMLHCGDKVITNKNVVGIVRKIYGYIDIDTIWPNLTEITIEYKDIIHILSTSNTIKHSLKYNDVIHCTDSNAYAVVKGIEKRSEKDINITIHEIPSDVIPRCNTFDSLKGEYVTNFTIQKQVKLEELKYRKLDSETYHKEIQPILKEYEIKKKEEQRIAKEKQFKGWYANKWIYGDDVNIDDMKQSNEYMIKFKNGVGTIGLSNTVPIATEGIFKWKVTVKHYEETAMFLGVIVGGYDGKNDNNFYCGIKKTWEEKVHDIRYEEVPDENGKIWIGGIPVAHSYYVTHSEYPLKNLYGLFSFAGDAFVGNKRIWDTECFHHRMEIGDEYLFELDTKDNTLQVSINDKLIKYTFNLCQDRPKHPIISFMAQNNEMENNFVFTICD